MKRFKKMMALVVVGIMVMIYSIPAMAATVDSNKSGTGTITVDDANPNQTYAFYRIFEAIPNADGSAVSYKLISGKSLPTNSYFTVDSAGNVSATNAAKKQVTDTNGKEPGETGYIATYGDELTSEAIAWLTSNYSTLGETVFSTTTADGTATDDLIVTHLPLGYYYITTTTGTIVSVDTTKPSVTVEEKNPGTSVDKSIKAVVDGSIVDPDNADETAKEAIAQVGTTVSYESRIPIVNGARNYKFTDTMQNGLTLDTTSVKVYLVDSNAAVASGATAIESSVYAAAKASNPTFADNRGTNAATPDITIEFLQSWLDANVGKDIIIQYSATVNKDAVISGTDGNPNTATINWGNETDFLKDEDTAKVFSAKITVNKTDGSSSEALEGAGFVLKKTVTESGSEVTKYYKNTDGIVSWVDSASAATEYFTSKYYVDPSGNYVFTANDEGTSVNPTTGAKGNFTAKTGSEAAGTVFYSKNAQVNNADVATVVFSGIADGTYVLEESTVPSGYNKAADQTVVINEKDVSVTNTAKTENVVNNEGTILPSTGGIGTTMFYLIGSILVIGAGVILVTRRRVEGQK